MILMNIPDQYFSDMAILLCDDCRIYEHFLKNKCLELSKKVLKKFKRFLIRLISKKLMINLILLIIKTSKTRYLYYVFHTDENECKNIFYEI